MSMKRSSKSSLFLMEMILVIFFFSICAAICVQVFVSARQLSDRSHELSSAVIVAQTGAETFKAVHGDLQEAEAMLFAVEEADGLYVYYDQDWHRLPSAQDAVYVLKVHPTGVDCADVVVKSVADDGIIYAIPVMTHTGGGAK